MISRIYLRIVFGFFYFFLFLPKLNAQDSSQRLNSIIEAANVKFSQIKKCSVSYKLTLKPAMSPKAYSYSIIVHLNKNEIYDDSIISFMFFDKKYGAFRILTDNKFYLTDSETKEITTYDFNKIDSNLIDSIIGELTPVSLNKNLIHINKPLINVPQKYSRSSLTDTLLEKKRCWEITFINDIAENIFDSTVFYLDKESNALLKSYRSFYQPRAKNYWIESYDSIKVIPDEITSFQNTIDSLALTGYKFVDPKTSAKESYQQKSDSFIIALDFRITDANDKSIFLKEIESRLILFDFSYLSCSPCLQSIPMLNYIYEKYGNKGLSLFWVDPVDYRDINFALEQFKKQGMKYPVYYDRDRFVVSLYDIKLFPTLFLVDMPSRKIIFRSKGYSDEYKNELIQIIDKYLK